MNVMKITGGILAMTLFAGCASMDGANGPRGPKLVGSGRSNEYGSYAEVGVEFSSMGDFAALVSPSRWRSPIKTGGSLSWINPQAWSEDPGRTSRILIGEAVVVGGAVTVAVLGGSGDEASSGGSSPTGAPPGGPPGPPPPPPGP